MDDIIPKDELEPEADVDEFLEFEMQKPAEMEIAEMRETLGLTKKYT